MEGSCIDDSTTSDCGAAANLPPPPPPPVGLCRMGSGGSATSAILDVGGDQVVEPKKLPSSKYKGVVPQPNGRWGAQIYEKHQRVWLGTFNDEDEAARAYDVAAQRFRGRDAVINFTPLSDQNDAVEISFLSSRSKAEIVDMLRKHTYSDELQQSRRHYCPSNRQSLGPGPGRASGAREQLFEKVVTPSDVGKLNRLVIPKQHAEKHFPLTPATGSAGGKGLLLNFEDVNDKVWRFRYSYWNSSQSYVLTKGWSRFVKEKGLKAGDVVCFLRTTGVEKQLYIDCRPKTTTSPPGQGVNVDRVVDSVPATETETETETETIRLFGVNINSEAAGDVSRKRGRAGDGVVLDLLMSLDCASTGSIKKRMVFHQALS